MSSLYAVKNNKMNKSKIKPSPAKKIGFTHKPLSYSTNQEKHVKRMFLFLPRQRECVVRASMTVEAAVIIPLFLFLFLHLMSCMEMLRLHSRLAAALWDAGNQLSVYAGAVSEVAEVVPDIGISYLYVHGQLTAELGEEYLESSPLVGGETGLHYFMSDYLDEEESIDIIVSYGVEPVITIFPFRTRYMFNRYYGRAWTGYDVAALAESGAKRYVYVTEKGEVWHAAPDCSYISHRVIETSVYQIQTMTNVDGRRYQECELCQEYQGGSIVYCTEGGEKYHFRRGCSAIYKKVRAIEWEDAHTYRACSRCGNEGEE